MQPPLLDLRDVSKRYHTLGNGWRRNTYEVHAVRHVSLTLLPGERYGLVGESGSGKSTLARLALVLERPDDGQVMVNGHRADTLRTSELRSIRREVQIVFQNPFGALNPMMAVADIVAEPLVNFNIGGADERAERVQGLLQDVGLPARLFHAYPHQLSGGERQRVCIARALALHPKLLVCDEPVSALDKSIQAQILNLLSDLQQRYGLAYLFISHDLAVINHFCTRVAVMLRGCLVEEGERLQVLQQSAHPYTHSLMAAAAYFVEGRKFLELPPAAAVIPSSGCIFWDRCPRAQSRCRDEPPTLTDVGSGHRVACHYPLVGAQFL